MRTEEEARYDLKEQIFDLYDAGSSAKEIADKLGANPDYVVAILNGAPVVAD
jgi:hypothetical protein